MITNFSLFVKLLKVFSIIVELIFYSVLCLGNSIVGMLNHRKIHENQKYELENTVKNLSYDFDDKSTISVVIPCYMEPRIFINESLKNVLMDDFVDVIIVKARCLDEDEEYFSQVSKNQKVRVVSGGSTRAQSQNIGATFARGKILLFLHADTVLPLHWGEMVREKFVGNGVLNEESSSFDCPLSQTRILLGAFAFGTHCESNKKRLSCLEIGTNFRSEYLRMPYGDQALFMPTNVFRAVGGFPDVSLMEDVDLVCTVRNMRQIGHIAIIKSKVFTSARRWEENGVFFNTFLNQLIIIGWLVNVPRHKLRTWYG